jgi:hypothetical protein
MREQKSKTAGGKGDICTPIELGSQRTYMTHLEADIVHRDPFGAEVSGWKRERGRKTYLVLNAPCFAAGRMKRPVGNGAGS